MKKIKAVALVLIMILCGAAFARGMQVEAKANAVQEKLSGEVFRFHVLANSDSKEDQELKMKVKEAVVDYMCENLSNAGNAAEAKAWAIRHKEELIRTAREVLQEEGCNDQITAEVVRCEFPDKTYGDIIFPAGWYDALRIKIGKAQGHNWWCVLYPKPERRGILPVTVRGSATGKADFARKVWWYFKGVFGGIVGIDE